MSWLNYVVELIQLYIRFLIENLEYKMKEELFVLIEFPLKYLLKQAVFNFS